MFFHQPTLAERKRRIRSTRKARQRKALARRVRKGQGRGAKILGWAAAIVLIGAALALLTGCAGSECVQVWADYTFVYPNEQGQAVAVLQSGEFYAPMPLADGCYRLHRPELGEIGTMEYVAPFCKGAK